MTALLWSKFICSISKSPRSILVCFGFSTILDELNAFNSCFSRSRFIVLMGIGDKINSSFLVEEPEFVQTLKGVLDSTYEDFKNENSR